MKRKIYLATDHAGFELKEELKEFLKNKIKNNVLELKYFEIEDCGANFENKKDDYPDFIFIAAKKISENWSQKNNKKDLAIIFGGSGQGEAMMANRIKNVRATTYYSQNKEILKLSKEHNNANILSIGARFFEEKEQKKELFDDIIFWINKEFSEEQRHERRILKIDTITKEFYSLKNSVKSFKKNKNYLDFFKNFFK